MKAVILPNDRKTPEQSVKDATKLMNETPVIVNLIKKVKKYGFFEVWICDNSDSSEMDKCIESNFSHFNGIDIKIFKFPREYKSGKILSKLGERGFCGMFLAIPCDFVIDFDIQKMISYHQEGARCCTVYITEQMCATMENDGVATPKSNEIKIVNSGFYVFEEECVEYSSSNEPIDTHLVPLLAEYDELSVYNPKSETVRKIT
jgi:NDP-sugar pyrophosphorylase family protein